MKRVLLIGLLVMGSVVAQTPRRFLYSDFMNRKLVYVDEANPAAYWEAFVPEICFDITRSGNRVYAAQRNGWREYDFAKRQMVREVKDPTRLKNITSACEGANGHVFAFEQKGEVHEFTRAGEWLYTYTFPAVVRHGRAMRFTDRGTVLLGIDDGVAEVKLLREGTPESRLVKTFIIPGARSAYQGHYLADGSMLVTGGYLPELVTFSPEGTILRRVKAEQPEGLKNFFYAGFEVLKNGEVLLANWTGHNGRDFVPGWKLIAFDAAGKVVWKWNAPWAGTPNAVIVFE